MINSKPRVCIIGAGPGGFSSANIFLANGFEVEIFEEGIDTQGKKFSSLISSFQNVWKKGGASMCLGKDKIAFSEGFGVGGGSLVNSSISQRIRREKFDEWQRSFLKDTTFEKFNKNYDQIEKKFNASYEPVSPISCLFEESFSDENLKRIKLKRYMQERSNKEFSYLENVYSLEQAGKNNVANVYKKSFLEKGGVIHSESKVTKLLYNKTKKRITGIQINCNSIRSDFDYYVLCAGPTGSPDLLHKSKILNAGKLPFTLHPTLRFMLEFDEEINADDYELPLYAFEGDGFRIGGSVFNLEVLGSFVSEDFENRKHLFRKKNRLMLLYVMVFSKKSKGSLRKKFFSKSLMPHYELSKQEYKNLKKGISVFMQKAINSKKIKSVLPSVDSIREISSHKGIESFFNQEGLREKMNLMSIHCMSSLPAGGSEVDEAGKYRSTDNLYVFDASILPSCTETNPQGTIMNISEILTNKLIDSLK
tara:strand:- start:3849 stop:5282 length:1434 start_codon:yes stop_codon:yes gene_type:complete